MAFSCLRKTEISKETNIFIRTSNLHSVYRMAAGGSASIEPKFPWPWMSGHLNEKFCIKHKTMRIITKLRTNVTKK